MTLQTMEEMDRLIGRARRRLAAAMINQAVLDLNAKLPDNAKWWSDTNEKNREAVSAAAWIFSDQSRFAGTFAGCCSVIDIDPAYLREKLRHGQMLQPHVKRWLAEKWPERKAA